MINKLNKLNIDDFLSEYESLTDYALQEMFNKEFGKKYLDIKNFKTNPILETIFDQNSIKGLNAFSMYLEGNVAFVASDKETVKQLEVFCEESGHNKSNIYVTFELFLKDALKSLSDYNNLTSGAIYQIVNKSISKEIVVATGIKKIDSVIESIPGYIVVADANYKEELVKTIDEYTPDILITSDNLGGKVSFFGELVKIKSKHPKLRIIILNGDYPNDDLSINNLGVLVNLGVYDIYFQEKMSIEFFGYILDTPKKYEDVESFSKEIRDRGKYIKKKNNKIDVFVSEDDELESDNSSYINLYSFFSTNGGTGKSTLVLNSALAISKYGLKPSGKENPSVLMIDMDFINASLSYMLNKTDNEKNIIEAIKIVKENINDEGEPILSKEELIKNITKIKQMISETKYKDVFLLSGNNSAFKESDLNFNSVHLFFLIDSLIGDYDVVICDINDDIKYSKTFEPMLLSRYAFNVLDLNLNSLNSFKKTSEFLNSIFNTSKHKVIINKYYENENYSVQNLQKLGFPINFTISNIELELLNDSIHNEKPIIYDKNDIFNDFRRDLLLLSKIMYPIKNANKLNKLKKEKINKKNKTTRKKIGKILDVILGGSE